MNTLPSVSRPTPCVSRRRASFISCQLISLLLTYALLLQLVPFRANAATVIAGTPTSRKPSATGDQKKPDRVFNGEIAASANGVFVPEPQTGSGSNTIVDAVVSRHAPTLTKGTVDGTIRVFSGESFAVNSQDQLTGDLYTVGTPNIVVESGASYGGTVSDGGSSSPSGYSVTLQSGVSMLGKIHTRADAFTLPSDIPTSVPAPTGTRSVTVQSQADVSNIGSWQTLRDLNVAASHLTINVPPGLYGTFTVNGNSQLNFTAGTYNFANTFNLDGGAVIQATGVVTINVGQNLTVTSGALALGSYTSPGDVRLNVLGSSLNINGSSQVSGLVRGANATVSINNTAQVRGQIIANSFILNGGRVTGAVWPARTGGSLSIFGPRRFDRTTGSPNQYVEQFSLPAGVNSPFTLHIQNGAPDGTSRVSSATASLTLNGIDVLSQSDLNQNVASLDRVVTLAANNILEVRVASDPGSYLIINIGGLVPSDITPPTISLTSPASNSSTDASQITVSGTASDTGANASGVAHVYVNGIEASYNSANGTWTISNVALSIGANQITARAVDQAGNEATMSITVTRQASNAPPTVEAGPDQNITLPNTASLHGTATDDGLPTGSTLSTSWSKVSGPGTVALANANALDTTASFSIAGTYVLSLTASDTALSTSDNVTITVQPQNQPPTVNAGANQTIALPHQVILNGTASDDGLPAGSSLAVAWSKVSGPGTVTFNDPTLQQTAASFSDPGTYVLRLTASDTELTSTSDVTIAVNPENHPPSVNAGPDLLVTLPNGATLNGTATDDGWPAGSTLHVSWSVISGPGQVTFSNPNSPTTAATFSAAGAYTLRLTASDGELSASDDAVVTVTPPNQPPNVNAGPDQTITLPISANLNGSVSDDGLPIGSSVATTWSKVSGLGTVTFGNANATATTASFSSAGVYVLRLTASDSELTATDDLNIAVNLPLLANDDAYAIGTNSPGISLPSQFSARAIFTGAPFTKIEGLAISQAGKLYVAEAIGGKIVTVDLASNVATTLLSGLPLGNPAKILIGDGRPLVGNDLIVADWNTEYNSPCCAGRVYRINPQTGSVSILANANPAFPPPGDPFGLALGPGGPWGTSLYVMDFEGNSPNPPVLYRVSDGPTSTTFLIKPDIWTTNQQPQALAFSPGNGFGNDLYVADVPQPGMARPAVWRVTSQGEITSFISGAPLINPVGLAFGPGGRFGTNLYILDAGQGKIFSVAPDGTITTFARGLPYAGIDLGDLSFSPDGQSLYAAIGDTIIKISAATLTVPAPGVLSNDQPSTSSPLGAMLAAGTTRGMLDFHADGSFTFLAGTNFQGTDNFTYKAVQDTLQSNVATVTITGNRSNQAPVINGGPDQLLVLPVNTITLNGVINDDGLPLGSTLTANWQQVSGPGAVIFANASQAQTTATLSVEGTYVLRLTASDSELSTSDDITVTVVSNHPPSVNAGPDQTISLPTNTVTLNGSASDDGLPSGTLSVLWTKVSGPGTVTFGNANSAGTTAQFSATGTYVLRLTANDGALTSSDDVNVTVAQQNQPPTVNAGADQSILLSQSVQLNGSASDDGLPTGSTLTTTWTKVSGPGTVTFGNANAKVTTASFSAAGTYTLRLTASDGALSASDDAIITVNVNVPPPTVQISAPSDGGSVTQPTIVSGSVGNGAWTLEYSLDNNDNENNRVWAAITSGNGPFSGTLGSLDPTMMLNGLFDIRLSATDQYGQISRTKVSVILERNLKVGNFTVSFTDLSIPVAGVPMEVTRTYDSRDKRVGDFGFGWTLGLHNIRVEKSSVIGLKWFESVSQEFLPNYCLDPLGSHIVTVTFPGGKVLKFQASVTPHCQRSAPITSANISFTPMPGTVGKLEVLGSSDVQIDGSVPGPVNLIGTSGGVDIFNSFVFKFTAEDGTAYIIDQRSGLQSLSDPNGNTLTIGAGGIVHSSGKSITFNRDSLGRINSITDPNGNSQTYTYDTNGDLVSYTDNQNNTSTYAYDANHRLLTIHDPRGIQPIRNDYDADGRLISHTDGFGKVITYVHNIAGRTETVTDRLGNPTVFEYDERGNVLRKTDARGGVTSFTYDADDNVLTETNALGKTTTYTYDGNDHRTRITDPLNNVTRFTYNVLGRVLTTTDPLGHVTTNTYNAAGNPLTTEDPLHNLTSYTYSVFDGQQTSMTDALNHTTSYAYTNGYFTKETDALGHETTFGYDSNANRGLQTVLRTNAQGQLEAITTHYEYDKLNRLTKTTFADGSFTKVEYNSIGQQSATIDQLGHRTEFTYDDMGRLTKTTYADATFEETTYDAEGRRLTSKDRAGHLTSYTYDEIGRLTKTTFADGTFTQTSYDAAGQVLTTTDAHGNVTHYFYDDASRRTKVKNALNQETTFIYDANGNQLSMTDALSHTTSYEYDLNNRRTKTTYADSTFESVGYDAVGRSVSKTDQAGKTTQFVYDALGRLTKVKDALNQETTYGYNEIGQQTSQTDANNHITRFEYDQLGRRVKRILPLGQTETYSYDNVGNLQSKADFNGKTTTFAYDVMRRLLSKTPDASLSQPTVSFTYNATGQRTTMTDASGSTGYTYDVRNRLSSKQTPFGTLSYTYDDAGNLQSLNSNHGNGVSVDYSYDALNRLSTIKDNRLSLGSNTTSYTYDSVGNLQGYTYPSGVTTSYGFNSLNRLTNLTIGNGVGTLATFAFTLGPSGNKTAVVESNGRQVNYSYDDLYRLTSEAFSNSPSPIANGTISYQLDAVGNRLQRTSSAPAVPNQTASYDANDRSTSDTYDASGNTTSANGSSYGYDFENRLTSLNNGTVRFVYDGDGNRVAKIVNGITTYYLVDTNNLTGYAQVVEEIQNGSVMKQFTLGHGLISQRIATGGVSFYGFDGHGNVRMLTNTLGQLTDSYDYDAFGNLINQTGNTPNDYLYAGEQFDANLGFYYLRARYMSSSSGRFLTQDSHEGKIQEPLSLHKYLYADADGINNTDPSGNFGIVDVAIALSVFTVVLTLSSCRSTRIPLPRTVSFIWEVNESQWQSAGESIPARLSESDKETIRLAMYQSFRDAFLGFAVPISEGDGSYRVRIGYSHTGNGDCDVNVPGATALSSDVYLCAACENASVRGRERNPKITSAEIISGVGTGLGRTAAHEFYHQLTGPLGFSQKHSSDPSDIMWGTNQGESPETIPWELYYGFQEFKPDTKAVLRKLIAHE